MHGSAYDLGRLLFSVHWKDRYKNILDVGALDVNGTLRDFCPPGANYVGVDMAPGKGVDIVLEDPHKYPFEDNFFDIVLSSSCFEHDGMFWLTFAETCRILAPGGFLYINVPSNGVYHAYPYDMWRFYPDSGIALERWAQYSGHDVHLMESFIMGRSGCFNDCVIVMKKGLPEQVDTKSFLSDHVGRATNLRKYGSEALLNRTTDTDDMTEIQRLTAENTLLKAEVKKLYPSSQK